MASLDPELQDKLEELEKELEVSQTFPGASLMLEFTCSTCSGSRRREAAGNLPGVNATRCGRETFDCSAVADNPSLHRRVTLQKRGKKYHVTCAGGLPRLFSSAMRLDSTRQEHAIDSN